MTGQLDLVIRLAADSQQEAAQRLAEAQARLQSDQDQLEQLMDYQTQYLAQSAAEAAQGISVQVLADARRFMRELAGVIEGHRQTLGTREREVDGLAQVWAEATRYLKAVEELARVRKAELERADEKRLQQMLDDLYVQQQLRGRSAGTAFADSLVKSDE